MKRSEAVDANPFSPKAIEEQNTRRFTTEAERAAVAGELATLRRDGYVIMKDAIDAEQVATIKTDFDRRHAEAGYETSEFGGYSTQRIYNLVRDCRVLDPCFTHPKVLALLEAHLDDQVQLSIASSVNLHPGETAQEFHRDDGYYPLPRPHMPLSVNTMWAIDDFTAENGATLVMPGTHRIADDHPPRDGKVVRAEMSAGSVMMWDGSLFHAGGTNQTNRARLGVTVIYARAWLRQQENQFVAIPPSEAMALPRNLQKLIGYWVVNNLLGYVDNGSPADFAKKHYA
ncbi:MAG: phytanoyl-CoA dioxygenase family protein [Pseudomonadota bacterium]